MIKYQLEKSKYQMERIKLQQQKRNKFKGSRNRKWKSSLGQLNRKQVIGEAKLNEGKAQTANAIDSAIKKR